jgi:hypothetical protein
VMGHAGRDHCIRLASSQSRSGVFPTWSEQQRRIRRQR